ncbi:MAG: low molecular weight phosphotyrosine protein phosphatase [Acidobacteria bacterium]|nr:low molecular weight phosphotyrosine protein phosphatase [Acidobacteriota bacterium]
MAEVTFRNQIATDEFLANRVEVTSAGTANWHIGSEMDPRARAALDRAGYTQAGTPAAFADREYLNRHDLVIVMTREHLREVTSRLTNPRSRVMMLRNLLQPGLDLDVPDPYYGDLQDFTECLGLIKEAGQRLTSELRRQLGAGAP